MSILKYKKIEPGTYKCELDLSKLYSESELLKFNTRWEEFLKSDAYNSKVLKRSGNVIKYPHKSWIPEKKNEKPSVLMIFGNPAPHSTFHDVYFSYEGKGTEHRFWKVLRELGYIDLSGLDPENKKKFFNLEYESPFRLGFDVIFSLPSSASDKRWSGVAGLYKLFGNRALKMILEDEKIRIGKVISEFIDSNGIIVCLQKDAYNALSASSYSLSEAVDGKLVEKLSSGVTIIGTPPTRWLYTKKMKDILMNIKLQNS